VPATGSRWYINGIAETGPLHPVAWGVTGMRANGSRKGYTDGDSGRLGEILALRLSLPTEAGGLWAHPSLPGVCGWVPACQWSETKGSLALKRWEVCP